MTWLRLRFTQFHSNKFIVMKSLIFYEENKTCKKRISVYKNQIKSCFFCVSVSFIFLVVVTSPHTLEKFFFDILVKFVTLLSFRYSYKLAKKRRNFILFSSHIRYPHRKKRINFGFFFVYFVFVKVRLGGSWLI